jgi:hypothetical protein
MPSSWLARNSLNSLSTACQDLFEENHLIHWLTSRRLGKSLPDTADPNWFAFAIR